MPIASNVAGQGPADPWGVSFGMQISRIRFRCGFVGGRTMSTVIAISLGAFSLPYASLCVRSLAENLDGDEAIQLLTDTSGDQEQLQQAFAGLGKIKVHLSDELWEDGGNPMRSYAGLQKLRKAPSLLAQANGPG